MAVGGYSHLQKLHVEQVGSEPDRAPRQKKHKAVFGGTVKQRGLVAARRQRLQELLDDVVNCEQLAGGAAELEVVGGPDAKHVYSYTYTSCMEGGIPPNDLFLRF